MDERSMKIIIAAFATITLITIGAFVSSYFDEQQTTARMKQCTDIGGGYTYLYGRVTCEKK